ncbi:DnaD and phage-associated domain-containing protein [Lentibacillus persicus]|uniref:DnaD and phage-associated domain-containing protein n=1 Tax=Lentibacillus persicus TaxID=640948 RepID=A0A1I1SGM4_9BACI|nr:DnaD domain protein [Lentibacillus persicus]SFD42150.1 DnaD and phage-associated domain-containing protein [Lentibacillus persicus]
MNYLKELNAFYNKIIFNPLSGSAVALWNTLMHLNNLCGWQATFTVPASAIELKSGIKGTSFKRAREELQDKGYIDVTPGRGNQAATYRMLSQVQPSGGLMQAGQNTQPAMEEHRETPPIENPHMNDATETTADESVDALDGHQSVDSAAVEKVVHETAETPDHNTDRNTAHSSAPLTKQYIKQNKTKHKPTTTTSDAIRFYQENIGVTSAYIAGDISNWISDMSDPLVLDALKRAVEQGKPTWRYAKGILKAWKTAGVTTVEQAAANDNAFRNRSKGKQAGGRGEVVPDWFNERKAKRTNREDASERNSTGQARDQEAFDRLLAEFTGEVGRVG